MNRPERFDPERPNPVVPPVATGARWKPLRSGLVNFYRYDDQEFHFHQGRLLLRGNNGTGKSRVLALQLPFLLDGETSPHRIEPDGDAAKRFEWNLLMGKHADRLGYTWIEFGRVDADGREHYLTLGCGVRAVSGRGIHGKWFFVTTRRVGNDLQLCSSQGNPLPKDSLIEAVGTEGQVFTTAADYRAEVNRRLFELQPERYEALIELLIELRRPKLSRNLDERMLSDALSNALPPVSQKIIMQVAEAMRGLEEDRVALESLESARQSTDSFLREYRRYAQILACRRAAEVRQSHNAYENHLRKLREHEAQWEHARQQVASQTSLQQTLSLDLSTAQGEKQTLEGSPEMRSARDLNTAQERAIERRNEAISAAREQAESAREQAVLTHAVEGCSNEVRSTLSRLNDAANQTRQASALAGLDAPHDLAIERGDIFRSEDAARVEQSRQVVASLASERRRSARVLGDLNDAVTVAHHAVQSTSERRDQENERVAEATDALQIAEKSVVDAIRQLAESYRQWRAAVIVLLPASPEEVAPAIQGWCDEDFSTVSPVQTAVERAVAEFQQDAAAQRAARNAELQSHTVEMQRVRDEQERLSKGGHQPPPPPYTRDPNARESRDGAPLWMLCEFLDDIPTDQQAALEAALESSGLLDAWVNPNGTLVDLERFDTLLSADESTAETLVPHPHTLAAVLRPSPDRIGRAATVSASVVERILRRIGLGENQGPVWVDPTGRWRIGPKFGRWAKPRAQHIGQAAREAARLRRLHELDEEIAHQEQILSAIRTAIEAIDDRGRTARAEAERAPNDVHVRSAMASRNAQQSQLTQARVRLLEADARLAATRDTWNRKSAERDAAAIDLGLQRWVENLRALEDAVGNYEQALASLWPLVRERISGERILRDQQGRLDQSILRTERFQLNSQDAALKAARAEAEAEMLRQTVGGAVAELEARLRAVDLHIRSIQARQNATAEALGGARAAVSLQEGTITDFKKEIEVDVAIRAKTIEHLIRFVGTGLLIIAAAEELSLPGGLPSDVSVSAAVDLSRRIDAVLGRVVYDDDTWNKNQKLLYQHVQDLTNSLQSHDYRPEATTDDDVLVVTIPFQGARQPMNRFSTMLAEEIVNRRALLTAKERELLENYLIHDVAVELGSLIRRAEELVLGMNKQMHLRPTSTGMMLRFKWEALADGPSAFAEARKKLLGVSSTWSPQERQALGDFLQEQIRRVRETQITGTWQEQLMTALDYRQWHQFHVERKQEGDWQRLNRRTHGTGSGGEKALALTIPQFAAAAAYYGSAGKLAPRLILLDEAFVGIDADMRSKCMGMLHEFDLDFVMTSEREWGCYPTIPGLAIYQLSARAGIDAVWASRWVWNGRERVQAEPPQQTALPVGKLAGNSGENGDGYSADLFRGDDGEPKS